MTVRQLLDELFKGLDDGSVKLDASVQVTGVNADDPQIPVVTASGDDDAGLFTLYYATPGQVADMLDDLDAQEEDEGVFDPEQN